MDVAVVVAGNVAQAGDMAVVIAALMVVDKVVTSVVRAAAGISSGIHGHLLKKFLRLKKE